MGSWAIWLTAGMNYLLTWISPKFCFVCVFGVGGGMVSRFIYRFHCSVHECVGRLRSSYSPIFWHISPFFLCLYAYDTVKSIGKVQTDQISLTQCWQVWAFIVSYCLRHLLVWFIFMMVNILTSLWSAWDKVWSTSVLTGIPLGFSY